MTRPADWFPRLRAQVTRRRVGRFAVGVLAWGIVAVPASYLFFMHDSRDTVIAGHDATVHPSHDGYATLDFGAYLPNLRYPTDRVLGVRIDVGKTNVDSYQTLIERYALISSQPGGEIDKVTDLVERMLLASVLKAAAAGLAVPAAWMLLGSRRRRELVSGITPRRAAVVCVVGAVAVALPFAEPLIDRPDTKPVAKDSWEPLADYLSEADIPAEAERVEVQEGLITSGTQRLIESAFESYETSRAIYRDLADRAVGLAPLLHQPADDETVAVLVTDRHDNIGMDPVARAIGDAGGATVLFDTGDDTSTGEPWESFSLDSLVEAFDDYDEKFQVLGNHDNGDYVGDYLADRGFTVLDGEPVETDDGITLLGVPDPRSSGLGSWKTTSGISFDDLAEQLADVACDADAEGDRIATLLVHDANLADPALERGCVDLVLAGHLHTQVGPDEVEGSNGQVGVTFTNGTTGGAAYAVAVGTKLRRDAQISLVTYRAGVPVGIQPVSISTTNEFTVEPYYELPRRSSDAAR